jgi:hypothetical protein
MEGRRVQMFAHDCTYAELKASNLDQIQMLTEYKGSNPDKEQKIQIFCQNALIARPLVIGERTENAADGRKQRRLHESKVHSIFVGVYAIVRNI